MKNWIYIVLALIGIYFLWTFKWLLLIIGLGALIFWMRRRKGCLIHDYYHGFVQTGLMSKWTGDHIGRSERSCLNCSDRWIGLSGFSAEHQKIIRERFGKNRKQKYFKYKPGDELDQLTKSWLSENSITT